jgi:hypothetical protein
MGTPWDQHQIKNSNKQPSPLKEKNRPIGPIVAMHDWLSKISIPKCAGYNFRPRLINWKGSMGV